MSAPAPAGPWWVTSTACGKRRATIKFKVMPDGYPQTIRVIALEGTGPVASAPLRRAILAAAHAYCARHRADIQAAFDVAAGAPSGVYGAPAEAMP